MGYIATTFAHGNGPYARTVDWAIELNNIRSERNLPRLPIIVPLVYPGQQKRIMEEEIKNRRLDFITAHPDEILFDGRHGELLNSLMFKGENYEQNLRLLVRNYFTIEADVLRHLDGIREVQTFDGRVIQIDLRDSELQLGLNNRMQTRLPNQFYTAGGAGPFDEILERAIQCPEIRLNQNVMKDVLDIARRMIENQRIIFSNEPGVFSYDLDRSKRSNEIETPPFLHTPQPNLIELPGEGIYLSITGIDGVRESGIYNAVAKLGLQFYAPEFMSKTLPIEIKNKIAAFLNPCKMNNPNIIAQYARAGWSSVWTSHLCEKGFITPEYKECDDPEMFFNEKSIQMLGLGSIVKDDPKTSLEEAISLAEKTHLYNKGLLSKFGTLDGIRYSTEKVADAMGY